MISIKYTILFIIAGMATGVLSRGSYLASLTGLGVSALIGLFYGVTYAVLLAIAFGVGLFLASLVLNIFKKHKQ